jgi:ABC-type Fe3+-hydroxamate transport system substrate-binding protein
MFARTTFIALIGASALLTGACGSDDAGSTTSPAATSPAPTSAAATTPAPTAEPSVVPAQQWSKQVNRLCRQEQAAAGEVPEPDAEDPASVAASLAELEDLIAQLSTDVRAVGVPEENAQAAEELADLYQQAADILAEKGPEGDLEAVFAELNALSPQINAAAQTLGVEDCAGG